MPSHAKKALPQLSLSAPLGNEGTEAAGAAVLTPPSVSAEVEQNVDHVETAFASLVAIGYSEEVARDIALGKGLPPVEQPSTPAEEEEPTAPLCPVGCFTRGWKGIGRDIVSVSCEHGSWNR